MKTLTTLLSYRTVNALLFLGCIVGMSFALYLEKVQYLNPCNLCIFQRVGLMAMGLVALVAFLHHPRQRFLRISYSVLSLLGIGWSVAIAARHVWIQSLPPDKIPSCGPGLNYLLETLPLQSVFKEVLTGSGECAAIDWTFLGQSLPFWSLIFFSILFVLNLWQVFRR